ncbi:NAD-dependent epimerase/dehydratase family protein [Rhodococcus opacus]|uniref:NAD-dependent epimerase/dehydratase family protein n=1 Tax=Rhodococcus opacus TaxID=37919 RepID=UPI001C44995C|nr:NAD-dependent epimerase/dehydratase family protein [Rhodococcus opacus]MBV6759838.1 NAD-dependent epimerase/dehydratase family protein [Rhodococcus opacus]
MKALVIGGTGPTGPYIVNGLRDRGYDTAILHTGRHETDLPGDVEHIHVDPNFSEALTAELRGRRFDLVVATYGRLRLFIDALAGVSERLITIGGAAYGDNQARPSDENAPRKQGHKLSEKIVQTEGLLMDAHEAGRYNITHLRYPCLYGPRQLAPREWSVIRRVRDGRTHVPVLNGGLTLETRAYVENAANAILLAVDRPEASSGRIYNVADAYTPSDATIVQAIAAAMGAEVALANFPPEMGRPAYFWGANRDLNFTTTGLPPTTHHLLIDSSRIREELGYTDIVGFEEGIRRTVEHYLEHPLGNAAEQQIGDPFDYAAEDEFIALLDSTNARAGEIPFAGVHYRHPYAHPKQPGDLAVVAGRPQQG